MRVALVTGGGRGLGSAIALALAGRGFAPVLAVRDVDAAAATLQRVRASGVPCVAVRCDVADPASVHRAVREAAQAWGRLDVVVNNAAVIDPIARVGDTDPRVWLDALAVNLGGPYLVIREALPWLLERSGTVVNLSSGASARPLEGWSAYCASKAGLAMLTRAVAAEYADRGLRVYGLQPGAVDTDMQVRIRASGMNEVSRTPRGDLLAPDVPARVLAWLADVRPEDLNGCEVSVKSPAIRARAGA